MVQERRLFLSTWGRLNIFFNNGCIYLLKQFKDIPYRFELGVTEEAVAQYMGERKEVGRGSFIAGKSIHNSRMERLWRNVYYAVIQTYYSLFYYLESLNLLDVENEMDLFCLHIELFQE